MDKGRWFGHSMVIVTKGCLKMEYRMDMVFTHTAQVHKRMDSGKEVDLMEQGSSTRLMVLITKVISSITRRMERVYLFMPIIMAVTRENGKIIALMEREL